MVRVSEGGLHPPYALSVWDAPHILPRLFVPMYEASLLLNGAILALCFLSPLAARFGAG